MYGSATFLGFAIVLLTVYKMLLQCKKWSPNVKGGVTFSVITVQKCIMSRKCINSGMLRKCFLLLWRDVVKGLFMLLFFIFLKGAVISTLHNCFFWVPITIFKYFVVKNVVEPTNYSFGDLLSGWVKWWWRSFRSGVHTLEEIIAHPQEAKRLCL